jgi:hypothetical protein
MNTQRIFIGLLWLVSLLAAYFIGGTGRTGQPAPSADIPAAKAPVARDDSPGHQQRTITRKLDGTEEAGARGEKADIPALITRARASMGGGMGGMMDLRAILRAIAPLLDLDDAQLQEAIAEIEKTVREPQQKMMLLSILLGQWAEKDGKAALDYADKNLGKSPMMGMGMKSSILGSWARSDPDAAWRWFQTEGKVSGNERSSMMTVTSIFAGLASRDLDSAFIRLNSLDESQRSAALGGIAVSGQTADTRGRVLDRSSTLPPASRDSLRQSILSSWVWSDSDAALTWVRTLPDDEQKPLRSQVGQSMLTTDPQKGSEVLLEGATDAEKPRLYDQIAGQWALSDTRAAGEWLTKQSQGPELDNARKTYANIVAGKDPAAAMDWAKSVTDPKLRAQSVGQIYQTWKGRDAAAADAALDASGLGEEAIQTVRTGKTGEPVKTIINGRTSP